MEFTAPWDQARTALAERVPNPEMLLWADAEGAPLYKMAFDLLSANNERLLTLALWADLITEESAPHPALLILKPQLFKAMDRNGDGRLDVVEYIEGLYTFLNPGRARVEQFIRAIGTEGTYFTPTELRAFYIALSRAMSENRAAPPATNEHGQAVHVHSCNECRKVPIVGTRFMCITCAEDTLDTWDVCSACKGNLPLMTSRHPAHLFEAHLSRQSDADSADAMVAKTFAKVDSDRDGRISADDCMRFPQFFAIMIGE